MSKVGLVICLALFVAVAQAFLTQKEVVDVVGKEHGWVAGINGMFEGMNVASIKRLMGFKRAHPRPVIPHVSYVEDTPDTFDARTQWPNCTSIGTIQNQAMCGACWAFGAVEAVTDRYCIHKGFTQQLSFEDMVSCDGSDDGCDGGDAYSAWGYVKKTGLVTAAVCIDHVVYGGRPVHGFCLYKEGADSKCYPYSIPTCPPDQQPCLKFVKTPKCEKSCNNSASWSNDKHKVSKIYSLDSKSMQTDIMNNGPIEACFDVYEDFLAYKSGVYKHVKGEFLGGHCTLDMAGVTPTQGDKSTKELGRIGEKFGLNTTLREITVKLLGWGSLNGTDYWLAANSWTTSWGDQGYFKISRGTDECGIEEDVVAGLP